MAKNKKIDTVTKFKIIDEYKNGASNKELARKYELHRCTIQNILKKENIQLRKHREKQIDENLFNNIDCQEKSYILGLIYSDGNLCKGAIEISLAEIDRQILEDISNYIYNDVLLTYRKSKTMCKDNKTYVCKGQFRFYINCKKIATNLKKIGLHENKSLTIRFPKVLYKNEDLIRHFIRGFLDGDGCIYVNKKQRNNNISITTNHKMCYDIKNVIKKYLDINVCVKNRTQNVSAVKITGRRQIKTFLDWIYKEANLKLNRKYNLYLNNYFNYTYIPQNKKIIRIDNFNNINIYNSITEAGMSVGRGKSSISSACSKNKMCAGYRWQFLGL